MPTTALVGALKRTRFGSELCLSLSPATSEEGGATPKLSKRAVSFGSSVENLLGVADGGVDRSPHGEPPRCGGCGLHCLGRLYACKLCERRVSTESTEVGQAFQEQIKNAFNLCVVCFEAHVRGTWMSSEDEKKQFPSNEDAKKSSVRLDVQVVLEQIRKGNSGRGVSGDADVDGDTHDTELCFQAVTEHPVTVGVFEEALVARNETLGQKKNENEKATVATGENAHSDETSDVGVVSLARVHEHGPYSFTRRNDQDQEVMDLVMLEKKAFAMEREDTLPASNDRLVDSGSEGGGVETRDSESVENVSEVVNSSVATPDSKPRDKNNDLTRDHNSPS
jgi:hypothetical protein